LLRYARTKVGGHNRGISSTFVVFVVVVSDGDGGGAGSKDE
jgi:hypothetical protein